MTLTVWDTTHQVAAKLAVDKLFTAQTGIKLDYQLFPDPYESTVESKFAAGAHPDILWEDQGSELPTLNPTQNLQDLSSEPFASNYIPSLATLALYQGKRYGVMIDPPTIYSNLYNKKVLQDAGLQPPTTFADLLTFCTALRAKNPTITPVFLGGAQAFPQQIVAILIMTDLDKAGFMDDLNANKATFNDPRFIAVMQQMQTFFQSDCVNKDFLTATWDQEKKAIMTGTSAIMPAGPWEVPELAGAYGGAAKIDQTLGSAPMGNTASTVVVDAVAVLGNFYLPKTGNPKQEAAARAYEQFFTSTAGYQAYLDANPEVPAFKGFAVPTNLLTIQKDSQTAADSSGVEGWDTGLLVSPTGFATDLSAIAAGTMTPAQAGAALTKAFQQNAKLAGLPGF